MTLQYGYARFSHHLLTGLLGLLLGLAFSPASWADLPRVEIITPSHADHSSTLRLSATLTAEKQALLSPRMDGLVKTVAVDAGDIVKQGDVLLSLDNVLAQQAVEHAKAATAEARAALNETERLVTEAQRLHTEKYLSATELATRQANLASREAALSAARVQEKMMTEQLSRHHLPAPFDGVISRKMTESGEWVNRGDQVFELVSLNNVRVDVHVPQERFSEISLQSRVDILPDTLGGQSFAGKIIAIVPVSNPQARSFLIRVVAENPDIHLLPGTSANVDIHLGSQQIPTLQIPSEAVLRHPDGGRSVFVIDEHQHAQRKHIQIQQTTDQGFLIRGLSVDDRVVVRGNESLQNGIQVDIVSGD